MNPHTDLPISWFLAMDVAARRQKQETEAGYQTAYMRVCGHLLKVGTPRKRLLFRGHPSMDGAFRCSPYRGKDGV